MKNLKISTELICEVLKIKPTSEFNYYIEDNYIIISDFGEQLFNISIYEFAFKCKEWARDKYDITISSALYKNYAKSWNIDKDKSYTAKTEVEVIIEACNWILGQNK